VAQDPTGGDVTVTAPADYAAAAAAAHPGLDLNWRSDSQRHLAPPKASQWECELHGMFDDAIGSPAAVSLVDLPTTPRVWAVPYTPVYDAYRRCWVVDIALDPGTAFWPFVKLAVARYQPESLPGMALSPVVVCGFAQLVPERIATVARPDEHSVRVVVTGPVGLPRIPDERGVVVAVPQASPLQKLNQTRTVTARLEALDPQVGTDLGWQTVVKSDLKVSGHEGWTVTWCGTLELPAHHLPDGLPPTTPGASPQWRVTVEEWERLQSDPNPDDEVPGWQPRLIYADHLAL
jgi:hypothetical protein